MPRGLEIIKDVIEQFQKVQRHMLLAKKENANETYNSLKKRLFIFKSIIGSCRCEFDRY